MTDEKTPSTKEVLLEVKGLRASLFTKKGEVRAVDGVDFSIAAGEVVGLVGESGSGKSMTSLSIMRLLPQPAGKIVGGTILFKGEDLLCKSESEMHRIRGNRISMVLQDPMVSLNQLLTIGYQIGEPIKYHKRRNGSLREMCVEILRKVKVPSPETRVDNYPFEFSGGMCQRAIIGMGIANAPDLLIADEPTTALDVTIQAQILNLMREIQKEFNTSIVLISHDLACIAQVCSKVMVMYAGKIVEKAPVRLFYQKPAHPYSIGLLNSVPVLGKRDKRLYSIEGQPPNLLNPPPGCRFAPRCDRAEKICQTDYPPTTTLADGHEVSCWLYAGGKP
ncbi:MAG: ABC transporter ATP-binding protein [Deltaproteobacteria bacterium]|nr:MAG: ABC transporter ATP-binding protein [Deltaproteobacteria bacterium]